MPDELAAAQNLDDEAGVDGPKVIDPKEKSTFSIGC